ncbi:YbaY family lipoprotein [Mesorhizobium sp. VK25A]|uniref:YbaY family lipoprotein n=1 Tax=Mesorhizobium vachelliae TaxID=3072309 RepID=A0ABU5A3K6_9HYPH|nr:MULTISPECIES: YbaY family lipoprotein [unclassified Mesorhizobium]MDX8530833.1 YbaY family lipoprotein [Mesorhizobium sp. VK25D]MDX8543416.1 YbaY family lipoprotein [Mesorhizobium sp. VK25A]
MMIRSRRFFIAALAFALATPTEAALAQSKTLSGTVTYRERIALPPSAVIEVRLLEVSRADAPATTISKTTIRPKGGVPVHYKLRYDSAKIQRRHRYVVRARILIGDELWFMSTEAYPVFTEGEDETNIVVQQVRKSLPHALAAKNPAGRWLAEDIGGGGVIDRLETVLEIADDGGISGTGGCNHMRGKATITGDKITFGPIASTNMACTPAAMDQEGKFFAALRDIRKWRIDPIRQKLALLDPAGKPLIVLRRM